MCPICLSTAATLLAAGSGVAAGVTALVFGRRPTPPPAAPTKPAPKSEEK